jgi:hypothetical protein
MHRKKTMGSPNTGGINVSAGLLLDVGCCVQRGWSFIFSILFTAAIACLLLESIVSPSS